ncbi:MAG TPA: hypothetical protein VI548_05080 [Chitinophagaceae bacterium]|nr:hypothetical protein [Chitinophagaceae bacterium]
MKKIILYIGLVIVLFNTQLTGLIAQKVDQNLQLKGKLSPNTENEDNETDPPFEEIVIPAEFQKKITNPGNQQHVSEIENGLQIVKDIVDKMIEKEYSFSLLSQHKYMINSCLGFKVSAGEFMVKFKNPVFEVGNLGKITIRLGLNKINLSALKIRMRPCTKVEHIPDPCHFGKKFEIGGEATDVSVTASFDPVARALDGSAGLCFFSFENVVFNWKIGGINLKPMQNNLDNLGIDMLEDGLNAGLFNVFYKKFIELSKEIIPKYFEECENAYNVKEKVSNLPAGVAGENITSNSKSGNEAAKWVITPVPTMKGVLGRLNTSFPEGVDWTMDVRTTADKFITNRSGFSRHGSSYDIAPGNYYFRLNTITVQNVPIEKGKETRLKAGYLSIVSEGNWHLYDETQKKFHTSGNKPKKIALPVGSYQLKLGGQFYPVIIKDGETVEY